MKSNYSKVEGMLYGHYRRKSRIGSLKSRLIRIENRIERLRTDIKECNVELGETMKAIDYSRDPSGSSSITSSIERELDKAVDNIIRELEYSIRDKYKTKSKISVIEKKIDNIELLLEDFTEEELQIIELRYSDEISDKIIGDRLNMSRSTVQRRKTDIVNYLMDNIK